MTALAVPRPKAEVTPWRRALAALATATIAILLIFRRDLADMAGIWWNSSTFSHCLLIPPILAALVHQRADGLRRLTPLPWAPGLLIVAAGAVAWLLGEAAGVALARHLGLVVMLQGTVTAVLGHAVARALLFPLFYAFFLVPAGEELVPPLQTFTAELSMLLLRLFGVPAHMDGVFITIPNGYFEVAEACSGIQFLVAMTAYGTLVCNLCFRSWRRRIAFLGVSVVLPVIANGLRAWATIYISWLTSSDFAAGFDHVVYGWVFFGVVIALTMALGRRFFDRGVDDPWFDPAALQPTASVARPHLPWLVALTAAALAVAPLAWTAAVARGGRTTLPAAIELPELAGWQQVPRQAGRPWQPHFTGADRIGIGHYRDPRGRSVDLAVVIYAAQGEGRELVGFGQGAVAPDGEWAWSEAATAPPAGRAERISAPGPVVREVLSFYRVGDVLTGSSYRVKLETLKVRLVGGPQRAVAVLVSAEGRGARSAIDDFLRALGPVGRLADSATLR